MYKNVQTIDIKVTRKISSRAGIPSSGKIPPEQITHRYLELDCQTLACLLPAPYHSGYLTMDCIFKWPYHLCHFQLFRSRSHHSVLYISRDNVIAMVKSVDLTSVNLGFLTYTMGSPQYVHQRVVNRIVYCLQNLTHSTPHVYVSRWTGVGVIIIVIIINDQHMAGTELTIPIILAESLNKFLHMVFSANLTLFPK